MMSRCSKKEVGEIYTDKEEVNIISLSGYIVPKEDLKILSEFIGMLNPPYFAGTLDKVYDELIESEGYRLWEEAGNISMKPYIDSILDGEIKDQNSITIKLN